MDKLFNSLVDIQKENPGMTRQEVLDCVGKVWKADEKPRAKSAYHEFLSNTLKSLSKSHPDIAQEERMKLAQKMWKDIPKEPAVAAAPNADAKPNEYRTFMQEHMARLKAEKPEMSQPDRMKEIAVLWAEHKKKNGIVVAKKSVPKAKKNSVQEQLQPEPYPEATD